MSLLLDTFNKKREFSKKFNILDKRKYRGGRNKEENLKEELKKEMENLKINNKEDVLKDLLNLKEKLNYLNFFLLLKVYTYFGDKDFDLSLVFENFDQDFEEEYKDIVLNNPYTSNLEDKCIKHKFRQDYIVYLFMLDALNLNDYPDEDLMELEENNLLTQKQYIDGEEDYIDIEDDEYMQDL
jgi:hypothetical protein